MGVELSKALNILAHELRGPLGVLQGYLRLLRQTRSASEDELRMLTAMQDATGRIAAVGRQAVELGTAIERPDLTDRPDTLRAVVDRAVQHASLTTAPPVDLPEAIGGTPIRFGGDPAVATAIAAVLQAVAKDAVGDPIAIAGAAGDQRSIELRMGLSELVSPSESQRFSEPGHLRLERGGLGLSLVLASYVFDAIGAQLTSIGPDGRAIALALRKDGGLQ